MCSTFEANSSTELSMAARRGPEPLADRFRRRGSWRGTPMEMSLNVISIGTACRPPRSVYQAVFHLTDPVDAADVVATLDIVFDPD